MSRETEPEIQRARSAAQGEIAALLYDPSEGVLAALLENPHLTEEHLCLLLERKELSGSLLELIARRKDWLRSHSVKRRLAFHPHTPRLAAMRLIRELYLLDLVQLSLLPAAPVEIRRMAEELLLARLPQLPLGQKLTLARRASARVVGALLAEGHLRVVPVALENAFLTEAQVLKVLAREKLSAQVVNAIARHQRWSHQIQVRLALLRHPKAPLERVAAFLADLNLRDLEQLARLTRLSGAIRKRVREEIEARTSGKRHAH